MAATRTITGEALTPGYNVDKLDIGSGLKMLNDLGWSPEGDANTFMLIQYALQKWQRGEEAAAEDLAIGQGKWKEDAEIKASTIDLTSWRIILAAAMAAEGPA